jgi:hypothetical protein
MSPDATGAGHDHPHDGVILNSEPPAGVPPWHGAAPVWWSAWARLGLAIALAAVLWGVIAWALWQ